MDHQDWQCKNALLLYEGYLEVVLDLACSMRNTLVSSKLLSMAFACIATLFSECVNGKAKKVLRAGFMECK